MMAIISLLLKILIFLILTAVVLLFLFQSKLLFHPVKLQKDFVFKFSSSFEEKFYPYNKNVLHGLLFKSVQPKARMIFFHGNAGALDSWGQVGVNLSTKLNADVLVLDYPGFGKSDGEIPTSERELFESAEAAFDDFAATTDKSLPMIVYGRSLGSAVASYLATKKNVQALILETPYTSMKAMAGHIFPLIPSLLVRYDLDNEKNIHGLNIPILIIHGTADRVVPYSQGKQLAAAKSNVDFVTIEGGDHNDLDGYQLYWESINKFVAKISL